MQRYLKLRCNDTDPAVWSLVRVVLTRPPGGLHGDLPVPVHRQHWPVDALEDAAVVAGVRVTRAAAMKAGAPGTSAPPRQRPMTRPRTPPPRSLPSSSSFSSSSPSSSIPAHFRSAYPLRAIQLKHEHREQPLEDTIR